MNAELTQKPRARFAPPSGFYTKQGAATFLQISVSSLERLVRAGRLKPTPAVLKKPLIFCERDLVRLIPVRRIVREQARIFTLAQLKSARKAVPCG